LNFIESDVYKNFISLNSGKGNLKVRAYAASEALPISGLAIEVSTMIDNYKVIFFEGVTDDSGMITNLSLPAPVINQDNLIIPEAITYEIKATSLIDNTTQIFTINMYDGICAVQNINLIPDAKGYDTYGS